MGDHPLIIVNLRNNLISSWLVHVVYMLHHLKFSTYQYLSSRLTQYNVGKTMS